MSVFFQADHTSDLSEYDSLTGNVKWHACGGHQGGPSLLVNGNSAPAYATADLGQERTTLYTRCRFNLPLAAKCSLLRGRNQAGQTCWQVRVYWTAPKSMLVGLDAWNDTGSYATFDLVPPCASMGIGWLEVLVKASVNGGSVAAWINGENVLPETAIPANSARATRYLDVGVTSGTSNMIANLDCIRAADDLGGPALWTPQKLREWITDGRSYELWTVSGEPSGGWQAFAAPEGNSVVACMEVVRGCQGAVQFADADGNLLLEVPAGWGLWRRREPLAAAQVRFENIAWPSKIRATVLKRS